jgi:hypothetical protein
VFPYSLALGSVAFVTIAIAIVVTNFTDQNAQAVQALLFIVVPAFSLLAVVASLKPGRLGWVLSLLAVGGIVTAGAAHLTWYSMVDERVPQSADQLWGTLLFSAFLLLGISAGIAVARHIRRTASWLPAVLGGLVAGAAVGAASPVALFLPLFAPTISLAALITVVVVHRSSRRNQLRLPHPAGP